MPDEARLIAAFGAALLAAFVATPMAIAVATRTNFHDHPADYKGHAAPTPYLGGAAVLGGFLLAVAIFGQGVGRLSPIVGGAIALWLLGTLDDRVNVSARWRLIVEAAAAAALWALNLGWSLSGNDAVDLALTVLWVVGLVNAFNLVDNLDGAATVIGMVTAVAVAVLALVQGDPALAVLCLALAGACLGFLPYNMSAPARIFLGDGGSLPIGFGIAASIMALPANQQGGWSMLLVAVLLAGLPALDTALVVVSRRRRGESMFRGGRDHLAHRLVGRVSSSPRIVAGMLGAGQAVLAAVAIGVVNLGESSVVAAWCLWFVVGVVAVAYLEVRLGVPALEGAVTDSRARGTALMIRPGPTFIEGSFVAVIGLACGLSSAFSGFYELSVWGPLTLALLAMLLGFLLTRPAIPRRSALAALAGLVGMWLLSFLSVGWAESADRAFTEANRWLLYAALLALLVVLLRNDRVARVLLGAVIAGILAVAVGVVAAMLVGDGPSLFLKGRLHEPLGFINGQAAVFLLGVWPLVAVAEQAGKRMVSALALSGATLLAAMLLLTQTRSVVPAFALSALVLVAVVPGRLPRTLALIGMVGAVAAFAGPLLGVYESSAQGDAPPGADAVRDAALAALAAAALAGLTWAIGRTVVEALRPAAKARAARATAWALAAVAAMTLVVGLASGDPVDKVRTQWSAFVNLESDDGGGSSRLVGAGGNRYDYWRVALEQFGDRPLAGVGAGNFETTYYQRRRTDESVTQPHSLGLQVLAELGLIGAGALALLLLGSLAGFSARVRVQRESGAPRALIVGAGGMLVVWLVQTSVDWLHIIPGVTGIAICAIAVLVASWAWDRVDKHRRIHTAAVAVSVIAVLAGAFTVGRSTLAERYRSQARAALVSDPAKAVGRADDSLALNGDSLPSLYVKAAALARLNRYNDARTVLLGATRKEPHAYVPWTLLGDLAVRRGDLTQARADYARASRLNPRDEALAGLARDPIAQSPG